MSTLGPVFLPARDAGIKRLAIAFTRNPSGDGRICSHAAILFRPDEKKPLKLLDLLLNGEVRSKAFDYANGRYAWAVPSVPHVTLQALAWFCERVGSDKPKLQYWFEYYIEDSLHDTGSTIELAAGATGLTCSTFVLAVLHRQGLRLLDLATWAHRNDERIIEDDEFQDWLLRFIEQSPHYNLSPEAVSRKDRIPCIRFTPEDVIGGCRAGGYPVEHTVADAAGRDVRRWTDESLSSLPQR